MSISFLWMPAILLANITPETSINIKNDISSTVKISPSSTPGILVSPITSYSVKTGSIQGAVAELSSGSVSNDQETNFKITAYDVLDSTSVDFTIPLTIFDSSGNIICNFNYFLNFTNSAGIDSWSYGDINLGQCNSPYMVDYYYGRIDLYTTS